MQMRRFWANGPAYLQLAGMWPQILYAYRANTAFNLLSILLQIYLLRAVWTAVYAGHAVAGGIPLHTLVTGLTLANLQLWVMFPFIAEFLQDRVRDGTVAFDLARPLSFMGQMLAQQVGSTAGMAPFVIVALPLALLLGALQPPASPGAALLYLAGLILSYLVTILIGLLLGLVAFWTVELTGFLLMYRLVSLFFSGALVPVQFFPAPLHLLATLLPFQAQASLSVSIYLGTLHGATVAGTLGLQLFWVVALYALAHLIWRRALRRTVIQGG